MGPLTRSGTAYPISISRTPSIRSKWRRLFVQTVRSLKWSMIQSVSRRLSDLRRRARDEEAIPVDRFVERVGVEQPPPATGGVLDGIARGRRPGVDRQHDLLALIDEIADGRLERLEHAFRESCSD